MIFTNTCSNRLARYRAFYCVSAALLATPVSAKRLDVVVSPATEHGQVVAIHVTERLSEASARPSWSIASHIPHARDIPGSVHGLALVDDHGTVPLEASDGTSDDTPVRQWTAGRATHGALTLSYTVDAQPASSSGGPPYGMIPAGGGIGGGTSGFLLVPDNGPWDVTVTADLATMKAASTALTSQGFMPLTAHWSSTELNHLWVLIGPGRQFAAEGFTGMQLGQSPPESGDLIRYAAMSYSTLSRLFHHVGQRPYRFMLRAVDGPSFATGTAEDNGAIVATGSRFLNNQDTDYVHDLVFHELTHQWTGHNEPDEAWFTEGLTTYIADFLRCDERLDPWNSCAKQASLSAVSAYGIAANWPMAKIDAEPFDNEAVRRTPYGRGMLYFAYLDAVLRRLNHVTLLDAMQPLLQARENGIPITRQAWEAWLSQQLGPSAVDAFRKRVLTGGPPGKAPETAFGRCVVPVRYRVRLAQATRFENAWFWRATSRCSRTLAKVPPWP